MNKIQPPKIKKGSKAKIQAKDESGNDIEAMLLEPIPMDSEDPDDDFNEKMFYHADGCYYTKIYVHGKPIDVMLSNFLMEILFHFNDGSNDTKRLIKLQRRTGQIMNIEVLSSQMCPDKFETILKSHDGCSFIGTSYNLKVIFAALMDHEQKATYLNTMGYNAEHNIFVFSDSIINSENEIQRINSIGIVQDKERLFYLPSWATSNLNNKSYSNERKFNLKIGKLNFNQYASLFIKAYGLNAHIGISFLISSLFRDIIIKETNFFPYLFLFGQAGTGKSTYIDLLTRVFGDKDIGEPIKTSSPKGIGRKMSQKNNCIVFLKEYTNTISDDMINFFKNAYDGVAYTIAKATTDNKTQTFFVENGIIIDGNQLPTVENALFDRNILLNFQDNSFTEEMAISHKKLIDEAENGLGQIVQQIIKHREYFAKEFKTRYREKLLDLKNQERGGLKISSLPERNIKHIAFILTPLEILSDLLNYPMNKQERQNFTDKVIDDAIEKNDLLNDTKDVNIFWDALNFELDKVNSRLQENTHYQIEKEDNLLYLKVNDVYPFYSEYCQKTGAKQIDRSTMIKLLISQEYFKKPEQKGRTNAYNKKNFGSCFRFIWHYNPDTLKMNLGNRQINFPH